MSAGQIWLRSDGLRWVEIQAPGVDASGWRLMVPLVELADAPEAPPLVITVAGWRARTHLLQSVPEERLGDPDGELDVEDVAALQQAVRALISSPA